MTDAFARHTPNSLEIVAVCHCVHGMNPQEVARTMTPHEMSAETILALVAGHARTLEPLIDAMWMELHEAPFLCGTTIDTREGRPLWLFVNPDHHAVYTSHRDQTRVDVLLGEYAGYPHLDELTTREILSLSGSLPPSVRCWFELRRLFLYALSTEPEHACQGLSYIGRVADHERESHTLTRPQRMRLRLQRTQPGVEDLFDWCHDLIEELEDFDPTLVRALMFVAEHYELLIELLLDMQVELNSARMPVKRRFSSGDLDGRFASLLTSCSLHALESRAYVRDLLFVLPRWPRTQILELAPAYWPETSRGPRVRRLLDNRET